MITVHLLRHGETIWHAENRYAGRTDVELTPRGRAQAAALAPWAASADLDAVASSDLRRAEQTAQVVAMAAGVDLGIDPGLREVSFGRAEGLTRAEMSELFPAALAEFTAAPATSPLPGGEGGAVAADRGLKALARAVSETSDGSTIAVIAHTTLIRLILCRALGIPLDDYRRRFPQLGNTTLTTLAVPYETDPDRYVDACALLRYNATPVPPVRL